MCFLLQIIILFIHYTLCEANYVLEKITKHIKKTQIKNKKTKEI